MGWLQLVSSFKLLVSFAEYSLFYRALLQKRLTILRSLPMSYIHTVSCLSHIHSSTHSHAFTLLYTLCCLLHIHSCTHRLTHALFLHAVCCLAHIHSSTRPRTHSLVYTPAHTFTLLHTLCCLSRIHSPTNSLLPLTHSLFRTHPAVSHTFTLLHTLCCLSHICFFTDLSHMHASTRPLIHSLLHTHSAVSHTFTLLRTVYCLTGIHASKRERACRRKYV